MSRQIVNTEGQGLAAKDAMKAAIGAAVTAIVVLLIFFFLDKSAKDHATAYVPSPASIVSRAV